MAKASLNLTDQLYEYLLQHSLREPELVRELREETARMLMYAMQTPPEETQFIAWLLTLTNAKRMLEIGTFTGYTTLWAALTMPDDAKIVACDVADKWVNVGKKYWQQAGVAHKIDLRIAPALQTLDQLLQNHFANYFDFVYIDADKENYWNYYERALMLVRPGGIIGIDNVLWGGSVVNELNQSADVKAIREFNQRLHQDQRIAAMSLHPIGDGLTLVIRK
uniref:SphB n=1 Tax=Herpetosiphon sp. B060 TaxID=2002978 RepID=A0A2Z2H5S2_9CHLR|nr:SphB [Herpetosiphon sp. B060]